MEIKHKAMEALVVQKKIMDYYIGASVQTLTTGRVLLAPAYVENKERKAVLISSKCAENTLPHGLRTAQKKEIIRAYRKLAQQWHPDNFQDPEEKKKAEKKFIDIAQAKEVLTDPGREVC